MDSRDPSAPPPHIHHSHLQHHQHQHPAQPHTQSQTGHHGGVGMVPHSQSQHHPANNSYALPSSNNSIVPTASTTSNTHMMHQQNPRFPFNSLPAAPAPAPTPAPTPTPAPKPLDHQYTDGSPSGSGGAWLGIEPAKKKRGRPRKYSPDNSIALGLSPAPGAQMSSAVSHVDSSGASGNPSSETPAKRNRGRPPGSGKRQMDALGVPGVGFTPHVIMVNSGEDVISKVMDFSQQGPRTVCILSANGAICNVTLRQPAMSSGTVTYEGRFEIISLSGSFLSSESNGTQNQIGGLSVSLAGSDGRVLGGGLAGILKAASPVQIIVGSFIAEGKKPKTWTSTTPPLNILNFGTPTTGVSSSPGASSESGEENDASINPLDRVPGSYSNIGQPLQSMPMYSSMGWPNSMKMN